MCICLPIAVYLSDFLPDIKLVECILLEKQINICFDCIVLLGQVYSTPRVAVIHGRGAIVDW